MPLDLKKLRDEYATLHGEATAVIEKAEKDGKFSDEDKAGNDK
jgi:hypothetical protein